jgi:hypothetical protein
MYTDKLPNKRQSLLDYFRQYSDKPIFSELGKAYKKEPHEAVQGLLGNYIMDEISPENMDIDFLENMIRFKPHPKMDISLSQEGKTNFLDLGWRF